MEIVVTYFTDSDYTGDLDRRRSQIRYIFTLAGSAVSWKASLQSTVALSTTETEYMARIEATKEALWLKGLVQDRKLKQKEFELHCDSASAIHLTRDQMYHERTKHVDVRFHFIKDLVEDEDIKVVKICT